MTLIARPGHWYDNPDNELVKAAEGGDFAARSMILAARLGTAEQQLQGAVEALARVEAFATHMEEASQREGAYHLKAWVNELRDSMRGQ